MATLDEIAWAYWSISDDGASQAQRDDAYDILRADIDSALFFAAQNGAEQAKDMAMQSIKSIRGDYPEDVFPGATGDLVRFICDRITAAIRSQELPGATKDESES